MKVYKLTHFEPSDGSLLSWHGSKADAAKACVAIRKERGHDAEFSVTPHDIPTDRAGLIDWLNTHVTTDNG